jgi:hypothetical protein
MRALRLIGSEPDGLRPPLLAKLGELEPDCARCAALCCSVYEFEAGPSFAKAKAPGVACGRLHENRCSIYATRRQHGFGGCVGYTCYGAGQRLSAVLGETLIGTAPISPAANMAFRKLRDIHEALWLLRQARSLASHAEHAPSGVSERALACELHLSRAAELELSCVRLAPSPINTSLQSELEPILQAAHAALREFSAWVRCKEI